MALDRILHGGLPCRTEAQARAEIAEQRWREANAGRYAELERRFDGPIPPDMKRAAQNSPMALICAACVIWRTARPRPSARCAKLAATQRITCNRSTSAAGSTPQQCENATKR